MPWNNAAWAIDGALMNSSLARIGQYAAVSGSEGIVQLGDLKVLPLSTPGNGIRVQAGAAVVLNRYLGELPDQSYVVQLPTEDVLGSGSMPPSSGSARSHLVCVTIGDPQYSAVGHPWLLGSDPPAGTEHTFQYVRTFVIQNVPAGTTSFDALNLNYPAYALARLDMPASTTTVQSSHIVDLRTMAMPRTEEVQWHVNASVADPLAVTPLTYEYWPDNSRRAVAIPKWASRIYASGFIQSFKAVGAAQARMRIGSMGGGIFSALSYYDDGVPYGTADRRDINLGGDFYIPSALRGTIQNFEVSATTEGTGSNNNLTTDAKTTVMVRLKFVEVPD